MMDWISTYWIDVTQIPGGIKMNFSYAAIVTLSVIGYISIRRLLKRKAA